MTDSETVFEKIKARAVKFFKPDEEPMTPEQKKAKFRSDMKFIAVFFVGYAVFRFFVYDWYIVPSGSMVPTMLIGDMPVVEKFRYGYSKHSLWFSPQIFSGRKFFNNNVKRGEVIVFKYPEYEADPTNHGMEFVKSCFESFWKFVTRTQSSELGTDINLIKRVIALPGDRISVENGVICVNGKKAELKFKKQFMYFDIQEQAYIPLTLYEEKLPYSDEPPHTVAYVDQMKNSAPNHFKEITVPEGYYFVMGDDRDLSKDSRCGLGLVPEENLMGRAVFRIWSIDNGVKLWEFWRWIQNVRYDRLFTKII